jgi:hypothetical protein
MGRTKGNGNGGSNSQPLKTNKQGRSKDYMALFNFAAKLKEGTTNENVNPWEGGITYH